MKEFNYVINSPNLEKNRDLLPLLFEDEKLVFVDTVDMYDLLVRSGFFPSRSIARKNWNRTGQEIPFGFSDFEKIGKLNNRLTIYNP